MLGSAVVEKKREVSLGRALFLLQRLRPHNFLQTDYTPRPFS